MIYECLKRWKRPQDVQLYEELTGGKWEEDFDGDFNDVKMVADPNVVSQVMKIAKNHAMSQLAESPVGEAAGMLEPGPAQELVKECLDAMDVDRPERFIAQVQPNPEAVAKAADLNAAAEQKQAGAQLDGKKADNLEAEANLDRAKALRELALAHNEGDKLNQSADNLMTTGTVEPAEEQENGAQTPPGGPVNPGSPPAGAPASPA